MKITFLCSLLEAGKGGVGDYTFALGGVLQDVGCSCNFVAVNDPFVTCLVKDTRSRSLRLPMASSWSRRAQALGTYLKSEPPDYLSLQFVPFGFQKRGIVRQFCRFIAPELAVYPVHFMFHELWLGLKPGLHWKHRLLGQVQKYWILSAFRAIQPRVVHTTNGLYHDALERAGVSSAVLPLFGNIPPLSDPPELQEIASLVKGERSSRWIVAMAFAIPVEWNPIPWFDALCAAAEEARKRILVVSVGRQGRGQRVWHQITRRYGDRIYFSDLGICSEARISACLQQADFGLALTPFDILGKSGAAVCMVEHGLPLLVARNEPESSTYQEPLPREDAPVHVFEPDRPRDLLAFLKRQTRLAVLSRLEAVANEFVSALRAA